MSQELPRKRSSSAKWWTLGPIVAFAVLAWAFVVASSQGLEWMRACSGPPGMVHCETSPAAWLAGGVLWSVLGAALTGLLLVELLASGRSPLRALPAGPLAYVAVGNLVLGLALIPVAELTSSGQLPATLSMTAFYLFLAVGLLLWGVGLLHHGTAPRPHATLALLVTTAGGVPAMVLAIAEAWGILNPAVI